MADDRERDDLAGAHLDAARAAVECPSRDATARTLWR